MDRKNLSNYVLGLPYGKELESYERILKSVLDNPTLLAAIAKQALNINYDKIFEMLKASVLLSEFNEGFPAQTPNTDFASDPSVVIVHDYVRRNFFLTPSFLETRDGIAHIIRAVRRSEIAQFLQSSFQRGLLQQLDEIGKDMGTVAISLDPNGPYTLSIGGADFGLDATAVIKAWALRGRK